LRRNTYIEEKFNIIVPILRYRS